MQNPEHTKAKCATCGADRGWPCKTRNGRIAEKVHYGRPEWSAKVLRYVEIQYWAFEEEDYSAYL
jgi:hypothetical protein